MINSVKYHNRIINDRQIKRFNYIYKKHYLMDLPILSITTPNRTIKISTLSIKINKKSLCHYTECYYAEYRFAKCRGACLSIKQCNTRN
jgi:hypothetical protein